MYIRAKSTQSVPVPPPSYGGTSLSETLPVLDADVPAAEDAVTGEKEISPTAASEAFPVGDIVIIGLLILLAQGKAEGSLPIIAAVLSAVLF